MLVAFATAYRYTPREYEQIYAEELWVLLEPLENREKEAGGKGRGSRRKTGQAALKWLFGGGGV